MLTPQNFREKTFERAIFGGYDMASVDDFLEEAANDYAALAKENMVVKSKMKVLVEKIEEYRATEDSMRLTLLSAQKLSSQIEQEAKSKVEAIVAEARAEAERITREAHNQRIEEEAKLLEAKRASAQYIENIRILTAKQLDAIDNLDKFHRDATKDDAPLASDKREHPIAVEDTVRSIETSVERMGSSVDGDRDIGKVVSDAKEGPAISDSEPTRMFASGNFTSTNVTPFHFGK